MAMVWWCLAELVTLYLVSAFLPSLNRWFIDPATVCSYSATKYVVSFVGFRSHREPCKHVFVESVEVDLKFSHQDISLFHVSLFVAFVIYVLLNVG